jgi:putative MATE family efflux protein
MSDRVAEMRQDILSGPITRSMVRLAWPVAASMVLQTAFSIIDAIWVGRLGPAAIAGVSTGGFAIWALFSFTTMIGVGLSALIARRTGEGNHEEASRVAGQGFLLAIVVGTVVAVATLLSLDHLFSFMQTDAEVTHEGRIYLGTVAAAMPLIFAFGAVNSILAGAGDTRTTLRLSGGAVVLAMIFDPFLIYGLGSIPGLGVLGAALAMVIGRIVFLAVGLRMLLRNRTGVSMRFPRFKPDLDVWRRILQIGAPASVTGLVNSLILIALTRITTDFGTPAVAALGICHRLEGLNYMLGVGFAAAAGVYVGQNLGAKQPDRAERGAWRATVIDFVPVGAISLLFFFIPELLVSIFTPDAEVISVAASYLRIIAFAQLFQVLELVLDGAFGGAGNTLPPMLISVPFALLRYPLAKFFTGVVGMAVNGVWLAISATTIIRGSLIAYWFSRGKWKNSEV